MHGEDQLLEYLQPGVFVGQLRLHIGDGLVSCPHLPFSDVVHPHLGRYHPAVDVPWRGDTQAVFSFDGDRLQPADTPVKLDMEDGDLIQVNL